jgi:glutathione S-transferase
MSFQVAFARKRYVLGRHPLDLPPLTHATLDARPSTLDPRRSFCFSSFNVPYPKMYAEGDSEEAVGFNCVQRGHQNSLELAPQAFVLQILMGLKFPITASILGVAWALGRILYFTGYASGDPRGRVKGAAVAGLVWLALVFGTMYTGVTMLRVA